MHINHFLDGTKTLQNGILKWLCIIHHIVDKWFGLQFKTFFETVALNEIRSHPCM